MSNIFNKTTQKVKKKVARVVDRLQPLSRQESNAALPVSSQQRACPTASGPAVHSQANEQVRLYDEHALPDQLIPCTIGERHEDDKTRCD